jgi:hypothetical protein
MFEILKFLGKKPLFKLLIRDMLLDYQQINLLYLREKNKKKNIK